MHPPPASGGGRGGKKVRKVLAGGDRNFDFGGGGLYCWVG